MNQARFIRRNARATLVGGFALVALLLGANSLLSYRNLRRVADNGLRVTRSQRCWESSEPRSPRSRTPRRASAAISSAATRLISSPTTRDAEVGAHLDRLRSLMISPS